MQPRWFFCFRIKIFEQFIESIRRQLANLEDLRPINDDQIVWNINFEWYWMCGEAQFMRKSTWNFLLNVYENILIIVRRSSIELAIIISYKSKFQFEISNDRLSIYSFHWMWKSSQPSSEINISIWICTPPHNRFIMMNAHVRTCKWCALSMCDTRLNWTLNQSINHQSGSKW